MIITFHNKIINLAVVTNVIFNILYANVSIIYNCHQLVFNNNLIILKTFLKYSDLWFNWMEVAFYFFLRLWSLYLNIIRKVMVKATTLVRIDLGMNVIPYWILNDNKLLLLLYALQNIKSWNQCRSQCPQFAQKIPDHFLPGRPPAAG